MLLLKLVLYLTVAKVDYIVVVKIDNVSVAEFENLMMLFSWLIMSLWKMYK